MKNPNEQAQQVLQIDLAKIPSVQEAIRGGHIERKKDLVTVKAGSQVPGYPELTLDKPIVKQYERLKATDIIGMLALCEGDPEKALRLFNMQYDTDRTRQTRYELKREATRMQAQTTAATTRLRAAAKAMVQMGEAKTIKEAMAKIVAEATDEKD